MNKLIKTTLLIIMASTLSFTAMAETAATGETPTATCTDTADTSRAVAAAAVKVDADPATPVVDPSATDKERTSGPQ